MSQVDEAGNGEFVAAVAAAAYAINSLGRGGEIGEGSLNKKKPLDGLQATLTKTESKKESSTAKPTDSSRISRWFSGKEEKEDKESAGKLPSFGVPADGLQATLTKTNSRKESSTAKQTGSSGIARWVSGKGGKEDEGSAGEISAQKSEAIEKITLEGLPVNQKKPGKELVTVPSIKKTPTFTDKQKTDMRSKRFASEKEKTTGQDTSAVVKTKTSLTDDRKLNLTTSDHKETEADAWEKAEMAKIKQRYEKLYSRILEWENEKKKKAKRRSERKEGKLELRRAIASQEYRDEIARIDKIVTRARVRTDGKKRNDERKTMETANEIRSTGKIPHACLCI